MLKKSVFCIALLWGGWALKHSYELYKDRKEYFYPYKHSIVHIKPPLSSPILFAYLTDQDWDIFIKWLEYWSEEKTYQAVFILHYEGKSLDSWYSQIDAESYSLPVYFLEDFDSSPYQFYPIAQAPAFYKMSEQWKVQGPFYRYE